MSWRIITHRRFASPSTASWNFVLGLILIGCTTGPPTVRVDPPALQHSPASTSNVDLDELFTRAYAAHVQDSIVQAAKLLNELGETDQTLKHYESFGLLANCYVRLGRISEGRSVLQHSLVQDSLAVGSRKRTYAEVLRKEELLSWLREYPYFPRVLRKENGFVPFDVQPGIVYRTDPELSDSGKVSGRTGEVYVKALINERGEVIAVTIDKSSSEPVFDAAAFDAVSHWKFTAYKRKGVATQCEVVIPVSFR